MVRRGTVRMKGCEFESPGSDYSFSLSRQNSRICTTFDIANGNSLSGAVTERGSGGPEVAGSRPAAAGFYFFSTDEIWTNQRRKNKKQSRD